MVLNGYKIRLPTSGGKAGKGRNRTSTVQVLKDGCLKAQFRFLVDDINSYHLAMQKAKDFAENN